MNYKKNRKTSVALNYDKENAPTVSASGAGIIAEEIIERAREAGVPIIEDAKLAHLLGACQLGRKSPRSFTEQWQRY